MDIRSANINFQSTHLFTSTVKKNINGTVQDVPVNFVSLEQEDVKAMRAYYNYYIQTSLVKGLLNNLQKGDSSHKYYAMTTQEDCFEHLDPSKILGTVQTSKKKRILNIDLFQSGKNNEYYGSDYNHIGQVMMQNVVKCAINENVKEIKTESVPWAKGFYRAMLFRQSKQNDNIFELSDNLFDKVLQLK